MRASCVSISFTRLASQPWLACSRGCKNVSTSSNSSTAPSRSTWAKPAVLRNGTCPSGWTAQGDYCVATRSNPKIVVPRSGGSCPNGYRVQGNYFVEGS